MPRLPVLSAEKVIKALHRAGFRAVRQSGSHIHLWSEERKRLVTVPYHRELAKGTLLSILRQAGLGREEFLRLL